MSRPTGRPRGRPPDAAQRQVALDLRATGLTLREIGERLGLSKARVQQIVGPRQRSSISRSLEARAARIRQSRA